MEEKHEEYDSMEDQPTIDFINFTHESHPGLRRMVHHPVRDRARNRYKGSQQKLVKVAKKTAAPERKVKPKKPTGASRLQFSDRDLFDEVDGVVVYNGMSLGDPERFQKSIDFYRMVDNDILTAPRSSTISVTGQLSNIEFNEKVVIENLPHPEDRRILMITCEGGQIVQADYSPKQSKKKAGAAESEKKKQFPSSMQFTIMGEGDAVFKIKLFRNGSVQIPGAKDSLLRDIIPPLKVLRDYMRRYMENNSIELTWLSTDMRNYICRLKDDTLRIFIGRIHELMRNIREYEIVPIEELQAQYEKFAEGPNPQGFMDATRQTNIKINEIVFNQERRSGINFKFNRPIRHNENKQLTIKVLQSGKIDFDGANSEMEVMELYHWIVFLLKTHWQDLIYDPKYYQHTISEDSDDYPYIYDDMLHCTELH